METSSPDGEVTTDVDERDESMDLDIVWLLSDVIGWLRIFTSKGVFLFTP